MPRAWSSARPASASCCCVWWLLTVGEGDARLVDAYTLPSPRETFASFPDLWKRGLSRSIVISLVRVLGGFLLAAAIGVPLGVVAGSYLRVNAFFKPLVIFGRSIPIAALIPLTMVWFGLGEFNKVMFIFLATIAFVIFDTVNTVQRRAGPLHRHRLHARCPRLAEKRRAHRRHRRFDLRPAHHDRLASACGERLRRATHRPRELFIRRGAGCVSPPAS